MESLEGKEAVLEEWVRTVKSLSESRHIISKATKLATSSTHVAQELFAYLLRTLKKSSGDLKKRKAIFYLLDSICQSTKGVDSDPCPYRVLVEENICSIVSMVIQPDTLGADNKAVVEKVLHIWKKREIFSPDIVDLGLAELENSNPYPRKGKRKGLSPEVEGCLKEMERYRHEHKKMRRELSLRPKNEPEDGEFLELWEKAKPDRRIASFFLGSPDSEDSSSPYFSFSPPEATETSKRGRTPSPATPSTPYSPSVQQLKFSPSSNSSGAPSSLLPPPPPLQPPLPPPSHTMQPPLPSSHTLQPPLPSTRILQPPLPSTHTLQPPLPLLPVPYPIRVLNPHLPLPTPPQPLQPPTPTWVPPFSFRGQESVSCASSVHQASGSKSGFYNPCLPTTP